MTPRQVNQSKMLAVGVAPTGAEGNLWMHLGTVLMAVGLIGFGYGIFRNRPEGTPETEKMLKTRKVIGGTLMVTGVILPLWMWIAGIG